MNPNDHDVNENDEDAGDQEVLERVVGCSFDVVVVVETEEAGHVRGSALLWLVFKTSAEGSGDVLAGKVTQVGLVVDGDCGMGVDLLKVLPGSVFSEDSIV